jgi:nitroreductase
MDAFEDIFSRHSISKVKADPIPREQIEKLLAAAVQAPNHFRNRPWRFFVLTGDARVRLGEVMAQSLKAHNPDALESELNVERAKPLRAPVLIVIGVEKPSEPKVIDIENVCASAAAAQNLLLAAHAMGLGAMWRTGPAAYSPIVKEFFGLEPDQHLIAFIYVGIPEPLPNLPERPSYEPYTTWME